jgi:transcription elongation factor Elf1
MKIKLSATFEGKCSICGKEGTVFTAGDEDTKKTVTICKDCAERLGEMKTSEVIEEFGEKDEQAFKEEGVKITSNKKQP